MASSDLRGVPTPKPGVCPEYWQIIRWDAGDFLSLHDGKNSRLYYDKDSLSLGEELFYGFRAVLGGAIRVCQGVFRSIWRRPRRPSLGEQSYVLLITIGAAKYASEEREFVEASRRRSLEILTIHLSGEAGYAGTSNSLSVETYLKPVDHLWMLVRWWSELISSSRLLVSLDAKQRALYVCAIPAIRHFCSHQALARRIVADHGLPRLVFSLCPGAAPSVAVVEYMKGRGVPTAGIRTQATGCSLEHIAINTEVLFCKSEFERGAYADLFAEKGPRLENGCLLSLPEAYPLDPLPVPQRYVLLLGTAPHSDYEPGDYERFNERIFTVAAWTGLPIVFKGHNLAREIDDAWFKRTEGQRPACLRVVDTRRNRELINGATLVVSAPSTLLYWTILSRRPVVVVEPRNAVDLADEFEGAPVLRIAWEGDIDTEGPPEQVLERCSPDSARDWLDRNYAHQAQADHLLGHLLDDSA